MFERFTDRARRAVVLAQEEARLVNHNYIGTEHILLGLIHEGEGVAARAFETLGIDLDAVRATVIDIIGQGPETSSGHMPFTPRAKTVLELSLREALQLGHNYIGTEHILLGLIREGEGVAAQVLQKLGADLHKVRQVVIGLLSGAMTPPRPADETDPTPWPATTSDVIASQSAETEPPEFVEPEQYPVWLDDLLGGTSAQFSSAARDALIAVPAQAELISSAGVGGEHLLLALIGDAEGIPAKVMDELEIPRDRVVATVSRMGPPETDPIPDQLAIGSDLRQIIGVAYFEAGRRGHDTVEPAHLLLGVAAIGSSIGGRALRKLEPSPGALSAAVARHLSADE